MPGESDSIVIKSALLTISNAVDIPVEQAGVLESIHIREGQAVKRGELIGKLKNTDLRIQLERAKLEYEIATTTAESQVDIEYAKKSHAVAVADLQRSEQANQRVTNSIPAARIAKQRLERDRTMLQLEQAERDFRIAEMKSRLAANNIELAQSQVNKSMIYSPVEGVVVAVESRGGEWVEPSQTVARVVSVNPLQMEGFVPAEKARRMRPGMSVTVDFQQEWVKDPALGKVTFIDPEANPVNLNVSVWCEIENSNRDLIPGMRGDIEIEIE